MEKTNAVKRGRCKLEPGAPLRISSLAYSDGLENQAQTVPLGCVLRFRLSARFVDYTYWHFIGLFDSFLNAII